MFYVNFVMQTMDHLKEMLDGINVTYDEIRFESESSIARLETFVSLSYTVLKLIYCDYNSFSFYPYI